MLYNITTSKINHQVAEEFLRPDEAVRLQNIDTSITPGTTKRRAGFTRGDFTTAESENIHACGLGRQRNGTQILFFHTGSTLKMHLNPANDWSDSDF